MSAVDQTDIKKVERELDKQLRAAFSDLEDTRPLVVAAHKTVATFSRLMDKKLWLKNAPDAYTNGNEIGVPYKNKYFYQLVEHEIAHNLFKSNFKAKQLFSEQYAAQIKTALEGHTGKQIAHKSVQALESCIGMVINIVEDHRIHSLWSLLYPGSYRLLVEAGIEMLKPAREQAHEDLISYFLQVAYDVPGVPAGRMDRFRPAMVSALKKVERKGPESTFIICKWLMTQLVSELIRELKGEPPPQQAGTAQIHTDLSNLGVSNDTDSDSDSANLPAPAQGTPSDAGSGGNNKDWTPPSVDASVDDRINAMEKLLSLTKDKEHKQGEARMRRQLEDVALNPKSNAPATAERLVKQAMDTNVNDAADLAKRLDASEDVMAATVDKLERALQEQTQMSENDWLTRNAGARVLITDVENQVGTAQPMNPQDRATAAKLKQLFSQVHSRKAKQLNDGGCEVDIEAFIANKTSNMLGPVFKQETSGRGFKTVVLLDRSGSMQGSKSRQVERGARILKYALELPYVSYETWGFNSANHGQVCITRVPRHVDIANTMPVGGQTPLHIALRTAVNYMGSGDEKKHIIVLTDGEPIFSSGDSKSGGQSLKKQVAAETERARKSGITVTALGIGSDVTADDMKKMFGAPKHWTQVLQSSRLGDELVRLVTASFMQFLRNG